MSAIAQLRHLYMQMLSGAVKDTAGAARGLLGPAIETLERAANPCPDCGEPTLDGRCRGCVIERLHKLYGPGLGERLRKAEANEPCPACSAAVRLARSVVDDGCIVVDERRGGQELRVWEVYLDTDLVAEAEVAHSCPNHAQPECRCPSSLIEKGLHAKTCPQRPNQERK